MPSPPPPAAAAAAVKPLGAAGTVFFGSLVASTFGLGVWQSARYFEKQALVEQRATDLAQEPVEAVLHPVKSARYYGNRHSSSTNCSTNRLQRTRFSNGTWLHQHEFLVGPRGAPPGVLPNRPGSTAAGLSSSPQGYFVVTPFQVGDGDALNRPTTPVLINRGWVPRQCVVGRQQDHQRIRHAQQKQQPQKDDANSREWLFEWDRPTGLVSIVAVPAVVEQPRFLVARHKLNATPPQLFWFDLPAMLAVAGVTEQAINTAEESVGSLYWTQLAEDSSNNNDNEHPSRPWATPVAVVGDFKVTPAVHAGYALTWYGLSAAGMYMMRMLLTRGR